MVHTQKLPEHVLTRLAAASETDKRTIAKAHRGEPVRGAAGERARAALRAAGLLPSPSSEAVAAAETILALDEASK